MYKYVDYMSKKRQHFKNECEQKEKKETTNFLKKRNACQGSNSRPQTQSCTEATWTGGLFLLVDNKVSQYTQHMHARLNTDDNVPQTCHWTGNLELW